MTCLDRKRRRQSGGTPQKSLPPIGAMSESVNGNAVGLDGRSAGARRQAGRGRSPSGLEEVATLARSGRHLAGALEPAQRAGYRAGARAARRVIGVIYESRPNVTADAGALCLKAGNAAILRGGSESTHSSRAIHACLVEGTKAAGLPEDAIQIVPTADRAAVGVMLGMAGVIDVIVPRGGRSLVERVMNESKMPVFAHLEGVCHVYVDKAADLTMAREIVLNAKMRRTSVCGAAETLLVDRAAAGTMLKPILADLLEAGCEVRGDAAIRQADSRVIAVTDADWTTEYLEPIISVRLVDGVFGAIAHINHFGSHHTDSIVTGDPVTAERFLAEIDSGIVLVNASDSSRLKNRSGDLSIASSSFIDGDGAASTFMGGRSASLVIVSVMGVSSACTGPFWRPARAATSAVV